MSYTYYTIGLNFGEKFCGNILDSDRFAIHTDSELQDSELQDSEAKDCKCHSGASQPIKNPPEMLQGEHYGSGTDQIRIKYRSSHHE